MNKGKTALGVRKNLARILAVLLAACALAGCGAGTGSTASGNTASSKAASAAESTSSASAAESTSSAASAESTESTADTGTAIRVTAMKGPTAMGMVKMMQDAADGTLAVDATFDILSAVDEISPLLVKGEADMAAVPANLASVLYNKTEGGIEVLAVNTLGVLYICEKGESVSSVADLKGKTIYASGKGATPGVRAELYFEGERS